MFWLRSPSCRQSWNSLSSAFNARPIGCFVVGNTTAWWSCVKPDPRRSHDRDLRIPYCGCSVRSDRQAKLITKVHGKRAVGAASETVGKNRTALEKFELYRRHHKKKRELIGCWTPRKTMHTLAREENMDPIQATTDLTMIPTPDDRCDSIDDSLAFVVLRTQTRRPRRSSACP